MENAPNQTKEQASMKNKNKSMVATFHALLAAVFYSLNTPLSKVLLNDVPPTYMAAFLYLGAGGGVGLMYLFHWKNEDKDERLGKSDLPYAFGMITLDILAPIFLMVGINIGSASNASLLGNFEIVATAVIALLFFKEAVSSRLWIAIGFITLSSIILSFEGGTSFEFSYGSLFVLMATICWGLENNCTRSISDKSTYQIVTLKGVLSGSGSFVVASTLGEKLPELRFIIYASLLGFVAYGLSIFMYVRAQRNLGAAKTSAYYAFAPFIGAFLSFVLNGEHLTLIYMVALSFMVVGTVFVVLDTMVKHHAHLHVHSVEHTHGGVAHTHVIMHSHGHNHIVGAEKHEHRHKDYGPSEEHMTAHANP